MYATKDDEIGGKLLRTTVDLGDQYKLHLLAPDEGKAPDGTPAWQIFIDGITDEGQASEHCLKGMNFAALQLWLQKVLPNHIPSSVVDKEWSKIDSALSDLSKEYVRQKLAEYAEWFS